MKTTEKLIKLSAIISGLFVSANLLFELIKNIKEINMWQFILNNHSLILFILWAIAMIWIFLYYRQNKQKEEKKQNNLFSKFVRFIIQKRELFNDISTENYNNEFTKEELEKLGYSEKDIKEMKPLPEEMKLKHNKEREEYWNKKQ